MSRSRTKGYNPQDSVFGAKGSELLENLRRASWLSAYDHESMRAIIREIEEAYKPITETMKVTNAKIDDPGIAAGVLIYHHTILRNKRILSAYHKYRMCALEDLRWNLGSVLKKHHTDKLDNNEVTYFEQYTKLLSEYMEDSESEVTSQLEPPKKLKCEVDVVVEGLGEVSSTNDASFHFLPNTRQYVPTTDVEHLIRNDQVVPTDVRRA